VKKFLNLPMHSNRIPPVDPAPATITAVLAIHAGHICSSKVVIRWHRPADVQHRRATVIAMPEFRLRLGTSGHTF